MKINNTLLEEGFNWEEIEIFWKKCIKKARKQKR